MHAGTTNGLNIFYVAHGACACRDVSSTDAPVRLTRDGKKRKDTTTTTTKRTLIQFTPSSVCLCFLSFARHSRPVTKWVGRIYYMQ